ncbi:hypothetical protein GNE08_01655 [Trichormus variabilis ARAD]|uniref:Uncharacterized protein n=2 Tax=Anabaena variabilis TaxID=264691 RepID=A0ABR6S8G8_ANAVA|nr:MULTISPECIES: hypothetical protein [Nostocaceae]MBC1269991.1 hypothetical protein [Trichormus variabilis FSR]MBC1302558.1 hypothetical protein [Trichormus variabilis N2B]MBC1311014.1 hypothetical protein [Trichormus variabilis PNB]MBC1212927.1 hypothetical protein [Trichormus variabilis ARAD]MBD2380795.1 hypothetical protein [Trichormus variabilis FACHB-319]
MSDIAKKKGLATVDQYYSICCEVGRSLLYSALLITDSRHLMPSLLKINFSQLFKKICSKKLLT